MAGPSPKLIAIVRAIDKFTDTTGGWIAWLSIPLVLAVTYEVIARYFFNAPTIWSFDVTFMLYGTIFMLGAAYALHKGAHIRTDFFWERWSIRTKGMIDAIAYIAFFFRVRDQRDFRADTLAADPVAVQDGGPGRLPPAADPGGLGNDQERLRRAHRDRARAQGKGGDLER
jgi:hypothetical protein